jgi:hypothetical protein
MSLHRTPSGCCEKEIGMTQRGVAQYCEHHELFLYTKALGTKQASPSPAKPRKGMKKGRQFAASKAQREKVRGLPCAFCGREASDYVAIDPAHVWPRGKGGCDHQFSDLTPTAHRQIEREVPGWTY